ncbi:spore maturation protein CgeD [Bacillus tianshenii]|uniref:Spore maturation protein CgeD n=1 Tax=Sutcliffiella tianshenii TaxID=1463404 RepID=A0ABS2P539_9BACI|nr:glycosyltransferase family A protein [Bacillus tianshenii]MBM7622077.1 spore maturation protein CgeD [Bacillus tianshenii]
MTPKVSIILTSYNKPEYIKNSIESVLNQTYRNWELFIMDDNSDRKTVEIIKLYLSDKRIKYHNSLIKNEDRYKTTRYATLINDALSKTSGKYITYLTDDNIYLPSRLEIMINLLESNDDIDIVYSNQKVIYVDEQRKIQKEYIRETQGVLTKAEGLVDHCSIMHSKKIAEKVYNRFGKYWDDDFVHWNHGDAAFWKRLTLFNSFHPINIILDIAYKDYYSFQNLYEHLPKHIPDGVLVKGPSTSIYLIQNQRRRRVCEEVFSRLKYKEKDIVNIPDPFIYKYLEDSPLNIRIFDSLPFPSHRLIKSKQNPTIFLIQNNKKHPILNPDAFGDYKFDWQDIVEVDDKVISRFPEGNPITELNSNISFLPEGVLYSFDSNFYIFINNQLHRIKKDIAIKLKMPVHEPVLLDSRIILRMYKGQDIS